MIAAYLPWLLSAITVWTMWAAGSGWRHTWTLSLVNQLLWLVWIIASGTWGLLPSNLALWVVSERNRRRWRARRL
jgi:hypothetical protein